MSIYTKDVSLVSKKGLIRIVNILLPTRQTKDTTLYDIGYEQAKKDIADVLAKEIGLDFEDSTARKLAKELRR